MNYSLLTIMKQMAQHDQATSLPDSDQQWAVEMSKSASQVSKLWKITMTICNIVNRKHAIFIIHFWKQGNSLTLFQLLFYKLCIAFNFLLSLELNLQFNIQLMKLSLSQQSHIISVKQIAYSNSKLFDWDYLLAFSLSCAGHGCHFQSNRIDFTLAPHWFTKTSELQSKFHPFMVCFWFF